MTINPFNLPEIRSRLALYVSVEDAISCIQVSKAFSQDFAYPIWHTIDFEIQTTLTHLAPAISNKYGHYIRIAKGIGEREQLKTLIGFGATKLSNLEINAAMDPLFQASFYDLVRRNRSTLTGLEIYCSIRSKKLASIIYLDSLTSTINSPQSSKLTVLAIRWLNLTRDTLTSTLRCCPALEIIDLLGTTLLTSQDFDNYQHSGVKTLCIFVPEAVRGGNPPIFVHFPNMLKWETGDSSEPSAFPTQTVKDSISRWCPKLRCVETNFTPAPLLTHLLANVFFGLSSLTFDYQEISSDMILALLSYPDNWTELTTYTIRGGYYAEFEQDGVPEIQDHFQSSRWMLQSILRCCHKLTMFNFPYHEMDMDEVEKTPWGCKNLEDLTVRIKGLDTRDKIEGTIARWREGRKQKELKIEIKDPEEKDASIEARVAWHLLQFDNLRTLWLGSKLWVL